LHTLCAFANDFHNLGGGYIFLGIADDNGRPELPPAGIPAEQLDSMQKEILELGYKIRPQYHPVIVPYVIEGRIGPSSSLICGQAVSSPVGTEIGGLANSSKN